MAATENYLRYFTILSRESILTMKGHKGSSFQEQDISEELLAKIHLST
jgi:hypothetical protein